MSLPIAIVGLACRYPDANSPADLWDNVLAQRRAFRRLPAQRLRAEDYLSEDRQAPDRAYSAQAALIEGYEFDRVKFRVAGSTFRSADLTHWLALDVAAQALADAGFADGEGLPKEATGVLLGNTLTGEFSRASLMRLRWPYVRRTLTAALQEEGWPAEKLDSFLATLEARYKSPFAPVGEESLAGGLSNTIAGRICNYFDLKGGGYTVDGACASSLLAVTTACSALVSGDLDLALAGGVDLSLDPFELVGFAKAGALAAEEMRVYDLRSAGFWPGEGCGFVVLMREQDALAQGRRIYATIRGWGVSSDGSGGMTRPEAEGQLLAMRRAYRRAGFSVETPAYFEGHGTGTNVGDATELNTLSQARQEALANSFPAAIGSIKANIGHTKAAAGVAGLIKATLALHTQVLPPTCGCEQPSAELTGRKPALRILREAEPWPADAPLRAGVSAMGFGGINSHLVLEGSAARRRTSLSPHDRMLQRSPQDAELFLLGGKDADDLRAQARHLLSFAAKLSFAELSDLAAELQRRLGDARMRAAVIASRPEGLARRLETLLLWLDEGGPQKADHGAEVFLGENQDPPRIGFLFPGQGSPAHLDGGIHRRRFAVVDELYAAKRFSAEGDGIATAVAQPAIVTASLAGLRMLRALGIDGDVSVGHSLGELTALHWAGAFDEATLLRIAAARGKAMAELGSPTGAMAGIEADARQVEGLLNGEVVVLAGLNSPRQTVISGPTDEVATVIERARGLGLRAAKLPVSHAFHSPLVAAATPILAKKLAKENFQPVQRPVISTITGATLKTDEDLRAILCRQVTSPVRFIEAASTVLDQADLVIEVGPGQVLTGLISDFEKGAAAAPASGNGLFGGANGRRKCDPALLVALDAGGASMRGLLRAVGAAFVLGASVKPGALVADRFTRPFSLDWRPKFFVNPCELAPLPAETGKPATAETRPGGAEKAGHDGRDETEQEQPSASQSSDFTSRAETPAPDSSLELIRRLVAERAELPAAAVSDDSRMLSDLHLNSITVGQLVAEAAKRLGVPPLTGLTEFANATVGQIAQALAELSRSGSPQTEAAKTRVPTGVDSWIRSFFVELVEKPGPARQAAPDAIEWHIIAPTGHPMGTPLRQALSKASEPGAAPPLNHPASAMGVVVCLPAEPTESDVGLLLEGARKLLAARKPSRFVLVQHGWGAGGFARSLHLEMPEVTILVVDVPFDHPDAAKWVRHEALSVNGYAEAHYDRSGTRREPRLKLLPVQEVPQADGAGGPPHIAPLGPEDVLLVTGGGKGIAAECALALGRKTGVRLALVGRSQPAADAELAANLERIGAAGLDCRYFTADVTDAEAVRAAIDRAEKELGAITAILHGAGANVPRLISALDEQAFRRTLAPKVQGLRNVIAAVKPERIRMLVTFSSIIARTGLHGEADYAVANEWLTNLTERFQREHSQCRCLAVEWSVWSGVGMGQRLGRIEALQQQGITPIPADAGIAILEQLLARLLPAVAVVVTGRFGDPPTLKLEQPDLPFLRFLEQPRVFYPGVELIVDAVLSPDADPYVDDHVYHGERLFPAVMGLEAMAQASMALAGASAGPTFEAVRFNRPVVVPKSGKTVIRVAALRHETGKVEVTLRTEETGFQVDHFRAVCRFDGEIKGGERSAEQLSEAHRSGESNLRFDLSKVEPKGLPLDPVRDLYQEILFHTGRFQRLQGYRHLRARECLAEIKPEPAANWFGRYLPPDLTLGDPGARDAAIHAIQACIPHARLLPIGVDRITGASRFSRANEKNETAHVRFVHAQERSRAGAIFEYDLELIGPDGSVLERWQGLRLRVVEEMTRRIPWVESLLGPYVERQAQELISNGTLSVAIEQNERAQRSTQSDRAFQSILGTGAAVRRRPDGKPELAVVRPDFHVSSAHAGELTLAAAGLGPIGCDMELIAARPRQVWEELLGPERFRLAELMVTENREDLNTAATRVWVAIECLKKAAAMVDAPLGLGGVKPQGWVLLASGSLAIATFVGAIREVGNRLAIGVLAESNPRPGRAIKPLAAQIA